MTKSANPKSVLHLIAIMLTLSLMGLTPTIGWAESEDDGRPAEQRLDRLAQPEGQSESESGIKPGESTKDERGITWIAIVPPGQKAEFWMGCAEEDPQCMNNEKPRHRVIASSYQMMRSEVTVALYRKCVEADRCRDHVDSAFWDRKTQRKWTPFCNWGRPGRESHPINCVAWSQARAYCKWIGAELPSEAQWEYAARSGDERLFPWGDKFECDLGNFDDEDQLDPFILGEPDECDGHPETAPVCSFPGGASPFGLCDMAGNVREWILDWFGKNYYSQCPMNDPVNWTVGEFRTHRGGSWIDDEPRWVRSSGRVRSHPGFRYPVLGFRCAKPME